MVNTNLAFLEPKMTNQNLSQADRLPLANSTKNLETVREEGAESTDAQATLEAVNLTEWLIFKIKIMYGRGIFEGDTPEEASAIRQEWQELVRKMGKNGVLATVDYLLSGHSEVPSFPPSPIMFRKCYRNHVSPSVIAEFPKERVEITEEQKQLGCKSIRKILENLKAGCFEKNNSLS